jgi:hypothetical protein
MKLTWSPGSREQHDHLKKLQWLPWKKLEKKELPDSTSAPPINVRFPELAYWLQAAVVSAVTYIH